MADVPEWEPRVAVLEQIARSTDTALGEIRSDIREIRTEMRSQFRWLLGIIIAVLLAQAALWLRIGAIGAEVSQIAALLHH
jgi:hypothetical protein